MQLKSTQRGMSGKAFLALTFMALALFFAVGSIALGAPGSVVTATYMNLPRYIVEVAIKFAVWFGLTGLLSMIVFPVVLDTPFWKLIGEFRKPDNDSHATVLAGLGTVIAIALLGAQGVTLQQWVFTVLTKGSLGLFLGILATTIGAWLIGVRSLDSFREKVFEPRNNSHVIIVVATLVVSMAFAMLA